MHAAETLVAVSSLGGRLEPAGARLRALLPRNCSDALRNGIREHKTQLLALLRCQFIIVRSGVLDETVYFAADAQTRAALIGAGAEPGCIYTLEELRVLTTRHQSEPIMAAELLRIHSAKRVFSGQITPEVKATWDRLGGDEQANRRRADQSDD
jgi:hypothetical protein